MDPDGSPRACSGESLGRRCEVQAANPDLNEGVQVMRHFSFLVLIAVFAMARAVGAEDPYVDEDGDGIEDGVVRVAPERLAAVKAREKTPKLDAIAAALKAAVESGEITEEQARQRLAGLKDGENAKRDRLAANPADLKAAVESGEITEEQAAERLAGLKSGGGESAHRERVRSDGADLRAAIESGDITREQLAERMAAARGDDEKAHRERVRSAGADLRAAIEGGEITREQLAERMAAARGEVETHERMRPGGLVDRTREGAGDRNASERPEASGESERGTRERVHRESLDDTESRTREGG